jgi:hypothetical protein
MLNYRTLIYIKTEDILKLKNNPEIINAIQTNFANSRKDGLESMMSKYHTLMAKIKAYQKQE